MVEALIERGETNITVFDLRQSFHHPSVTFHIGDLTNTQNVQEACIGKTIVFHTASPPHGRPAEFYTKVNLYGTQNVIQACLQAGVQKLIYTSSCSVVFDGSDLKGGDETLPYCENPMDPYNDTKVPVHYIIFSLCLSFFPYLYIDLSFSFFHHFSTNFET